MKKIISIALLNFKQATRDKVFSGTVLFFIFYLFFCVLLKELSPGHAEKVLRNVGLVGIELTSIIFIIFSFTVTFFKERETRILEVYLSNCPRASYISGKIIGYIFITIVYLCFSSCAYFFVLKLFGAFEFSVLAALYPLFLKIILIILITSIFSCLFSSAALALLATLFLYLGCELMPMALKIVRNYGAGRQKLMVENLYSFLPNMDKLDIKQLAVYGQFPSAGYLLLISFYAIIYIVGLWIINVFVFQKKRY
ncbi:MAG: hypothetical protein KJ915_08785 [Candidatus Omnitrophica bacterium]|nr:hypothetical protein [Candidatus Omnitrophota bacterium]